MHGKKEVFDLLFPKSTLRVLTDFEVYPYEKIKMSKPIPLKAMGRFRHEAVAFDPVNKLVYQTEDREDGLFYRFIPNAFENLKKGGKLQALSIKGNLGNDCSNWKNNYFNKDEKYKVKWIDLDNVDTKEDDLRYRGIEKGCSFFARGEGLWYSDDYVYFTSTNGGKDKLGQIWRYRHTKEQEYEGELELFFESNDKDILKLPDNITVTPWGDILISEDGKGHDRLIGINKKGETYCLAENILNKSEFAGACFSPDKKILFVNIYKPTMTLAIKGPWNDFI